MVNEALSDQRWWCHQITNQRWIQAWCIPVSPAETVYKLCWGLLNRSKVSLWDADAGFSWRVAAGLEARDDAGVVPPLTPRTRPGVWAGAWRKTLNTFTSIGLVEQLRNTCHLTGTIIIIWYLWKIEILKKVLWFWIILTTIWESNNGPTCGCSRVKRVKTYLTVSIKLLIQYWYEIKITLMSTQSAGKVV